MIISNYSTTCITLQKHFNHSQLKSIFQTKTKKNNFIIIIQSRGIRKEPFAYKNVSTEFSWWGGDQKAKKGKSLC